MVQGYKQDWAKSMITSLAVIQSLQCQHTQKSGLQIYNKCRPFPDGTIPEQQVGLFFFFFDDSQVINQPEEIPQGFPCVHLRLRQNQIESSEDS